MESGKIVSFIFIGAMMWRRWGGGALLFSYVLWCYCIGSYNSASTQAKYFGSLSEFAVLFAKQVFANSPWGNLCFFFKKKHRKLYYFLYSCDGAFIPPVILMLFIFIFHRKRYIHFVEHTKFLAQDKHLILRYKHQKYTGMNNHFRFR